MPRRPIRRRLVRHGVTHLRMHDKVLLDFPVATVCRLHSLLKTHEHVLAPRKAFIGGMPEAIKCALCEKLRIWLILSYLIFFTFPLFHVNISAARCLSRMWCAEQLNRAGRKMWNHDYVKLFVSGPRFFLQQHLRSVTPAPLMARSCFCLFVFDADISKDEKKPSGWPVFFRLSCVFRNMSPRFFSLVIILRWARLNKGFHGMLSLLE